MALTPTCGEIHFNGKCHSNLSKQSYILRLTRWSMGYRMRDYLVRRNSLVRFDAGIGYDTTYRLPAASNPDMFHIRGPTSDAVKLVDESDPTQTAIEEVSFKIGPCGFGLVLIVHVSDQVPLFSAYSTLHKGAIIHHRRETYEVPSTFHVLSPALKVLIVQAQCRFKIFC